jgi:hypothetical protein
MRSSPPTTNAWVGASSGCHRSDPISISTVSFTQEEVANKHAFYNFVEQDPVASRAMTVVVWSEDGEIRTGEPCSLSPRGAAR